MRRICWRVGDNGGRKRRGKLESARAVIVFVVVVIVVVFAIIGLGPRRACRCG